MYHASQMLAVVNVLSHACSLEKPAMLLRIDSGFSPPCLYHCDSHTRISNLLNEIEIHTLVSERRVCLCVYRCVYISHCYFLLLPSGDVFWLVDSSCTSSASLQRQKCGSIYEPTSAVQFHGSCPGITLYRSAERRQSASFRDRTLNDLLDVCTDDLSTTTLLHLQILVLYIIIIARVSS